MIKARTAIKYTLIFLAISYCTWRLISPNIYYGEVTTGSYYDGKWHMEKKIEYYWIDKHNWAFGDLRVKLFERKINDGLER